MAERLNPEFSEIVVSCVTELSNDLGFPSSKLPDERQVAISKDECIASAIGYSSPQIKGSVTVLSPKSLLAKSHPNLQMEMPVGDQEVEDWIGEISNQLLGRIKNKLLKFGATVSMATPSVLAGNAMVPKEPKEGASSTFKFQSEHGSLVVTVNAVLAPGYKFEAVGESATSAAKEGASMLF